MSAARRPRAAPDHTGDPGQWWVGAAAFTDQLGEAMDLTLANTARLAIFRILDRLLIDPFNNEASAELVHAQQSLGRDVKSAQARQVNRCRTGGRTADSQQETQ